jgi:DNA polymerase III subunit delta
MSGNLSLNGSNPPKIEPQIQIITGQDGFRKRLYLDRLKRDIVGKGNNPFSYILYNAKDMEFPDLLHSLQNLSIASGPRMVALTEPEILPEHDRKRLADCLTETIEKSVFFIMIADRPSAKLDRFISTLPDKVRRVDLSPARQSDMNQWIELEFKKLKKRISRKALCLISESAMDDFGKALSVIEQVSLFTADRENITENDVRFFVDAAIDNSVSELLASIHSNSPDKALLISKDILISGSSPVQMIGLLTWHVTRLIRIKKLLIRGVSRNEMFSYLKIGSYRLNNLVAQAGRTTLKKLKNNLHELINTDLLVKTSNIKTDMLIEMLVVKLAR